MEVSGRRPIRRKRMRQLESSFVIDGNRKDFEPPIYQPLLDRHLQMFFLRENRLSILRQHRLINKRYEVVDRTVSRPSTGHIRTKSFERPNALTHNNKMGESANLPSKHLSKLEKPVLVGY